MGQEQEKDLQDTLWLKTGEVIPCMVVGSTNMWKTIVVKKYNIPFHAGVAKQLGFNVFNEIQAEGTTEDELF